MDIATGAGNRTMCQLISCPQNTEKKHEDLLELILCHNTI